MRTRLLLLVLLAPQVALAEPVGEPGESCRARADCRQDLRCLDGVCAVVKPGANTGFSFTDGKMHPFMAVTATGGFALQAVSGTGAGVGTVSGAFGWALD